MWPALVIFVAVYVLLSFPGLPRRAERFLAHEGLRRWSARLFARPGIALAGALLLVVVGELSPWEAWSAVSFETLALLTGMMLLVSALEAANVFAVLASWLVRRFPTPRRLLVATMCAVAVLSALVLNDAVVLLFTPVLVAAASALGVPAFPLLAAEAFAANLGSAATPTGNPQNAAIALAYGLSFTQFAARAALVSLLGLAVGVALCLVAFRRDLPHAKPNASLPEERVTNRALLVVALGSVALALVGFVLGPRLGVPLWASALGAGVLATVLAPAARESPLRVARGVDAGVLVFFVGLFVLVEGVRGSGIMDEAARYVGGSGGLVVVTATLSNLVSNVPAVLLLLPIVPASAAVLLAVSSTFAGNATFLGSAATVIVAETARARGAEFSVARFTLVGLPLAAVTLALAWLVLG